MIATLVAAMVGFLGGAFATYLGNQGRLDFSSNTRKTQNSEISA